MTTTITSDREDLIVPKSVRRRAGLKQGDRVEFKVSGKVITIVPKLPSADKEYTEGERRAIDAALERAAQGPYYGPFETAAAASEFLRKGIRRRRKSSATRE